MRWQIKCVVDNGKGLIPFQHALRRWKRRVVPYRPSLSRGEFAIEEGIRQVEWMRESLGTLAGKRILEIGSGWEVLLPMLFSLCGAERVYLTDLTALLDRDTLAGGLESFRHNRQRIVESLHLDGREFDRKFEGEIASQQQFLAAHGLVYLAPCDCRHLDLPAASLDAITSRSVFEHIPREVIVEILKECYRLLAPGGLVCHFVDNSDHWEHGDKSISRVNFLRFSDGAFRLTYWNGLNYQNRLRHSEYVAMLRECGFEILRQDRNVDARALDALKGMVLAPRFGKFTPEDLATTDSFLLARKPA
ncbi:MAG TPA: class I SAM-dependent methyltransferase [Bryobacteraceae bacterium]|jgi:SAM-dependent methyltransferase|nr:class I SAM-dependent methyltransferase [Bryobacteraceae bacterium]